MPEILKPTLQTANQVISWSVVGTTFVLSLAYFWHNTELGYGSDPE